MKINTMEVSGFLPAMHGMRSPMNSWHLNDSAYSWGHDEYFSLRDNNFDGEYIIGDNVGHSVFIGEKDLDLASRLIKAGPEHCKFLRQIQVWAEMDMPLYFWSEFDTYKFNTKNSCSTMHKLFNAKKKIELEDFVYDKEDEFVLKMIINELNILRIKYLETKDFNLVVRGKKLLPTGFKQKRVVNTNYAELINIYLQRKNHRLKEEWQDTFCAWCHTLPYFTEFLEAGGKK